MDFPEQMNWLVFVRVSCSAMTPEHQRGAPKEEFFITDVAYCEQAVILLKQAKLPQNNTLCRKEDGTLPVSFQFSISHSFSRTTVNSQIKMLSSWKFCKQSSDEMARTYKGNFSGALGKMQLL